MDIAMSNRGGIFGPPRNITRNLRRLCRLLGIYVPSQILGSIQSVFFSAIPRASGAEPIL
jgi:hypothetical protein